MFHFNTTENFKTQSKGQEASNKWRRNSLLVNNDTAKNFPQWIFYKNKNAFIIDNHLAKET